MHVASGYPKAAAHKQMHDDLIQTYQGLRDEYKASGNNMTVFLKINKAVSTWLSNHIMVHDKEFGDYYKKLPAK
ncbi:hypothetical protein FACS1894186_0640 [Alphaproteobacteria bacterium]|nr:hypothetical protein FACS1894186_0640 [Alphaproteobacteria bacterium]